MRTILRYLLFITAAVFLAMVWPGAPAMGDNAQSSLLVEGEYRLSRSTGPYVFSSIEVLPAGHLIIEAGTSIYLNQDGFIDVQGSLEAVGSENDPIIFAGNGPRWKTLTIEAEAPPARLAFIQFRDFMGPLSLRNYQPRIDHLSLVNGEHNMLIIGEEGNHYGSFVAAGLVFGSRSLVDFPIESGVQLLGSYSVMPLIDVVTFYDSRPFADIPWDTMSISAIAPSSWLEISDGTFPYGCNGVIRLPESSDHPSSVFGVDLSSCRNPVLPTLFVPGYGTSINLAALTSVPNKGAAAEGSWRFFHQLSPSYDNLEAAYRQADIPYEVAYYDWRLPAADIARLYLKPRIEEMKQKYHVDSVNLVAHSFGGIVARSYIQGPTYASDVANLVQVATPNQGAAKAYGAWEGGELPPDWSSLYALVRLYQLLFRRFTDSVVSIIHEFFPSAREMLPIYPALYRNGSYLDPASLHEINQTLLDLRSRLPDLYERTRVKVIASQSELTREAIPLGNPHFQSEEWPDGLALSDGYSPIPNGDGTVPLQSVLLDGATKEIVAGTHAKLPGLAAQNILSYLYPQADQPSGAPPDQSPEAVSIYIDCPVSAVVTLPDGRRRSSLDVDPGGLPGNDPLQVGEAEQNEDLIWLVVPREEGEYHLDIQAEEDTSVRWWVENGEVHSFDLSQNEVGSFDFVAPETPAVNEPITSSEQEEQKSPLAAAIVDSSPPSEQSFTLPVREVFLKNISRNKSSSLPFLEGRGEGAPLPSQRLLAALAWSRSGSGTTFHMEELIGLIGCLLSVMSVAIYLLRFRRLSRCFASQSM